MRVRSFSTIRPFVLISTIAFAVLIAAALLVPQAVTAKKYVYPKAMMEDVVDNYHGTEVRDPYRWMDDPAAPATKEWVAAQNKLTRSFIDNFPGRADLEARLTELWDFPKYGMPEKHGDRYFFEKNDGLQNQSVLYMQKKLDGEAVVVIDPNTLSDDGTIDVRDQEFSHDGKLMAYRLSKSGSDRQEIKIRNVDTGEDYPETIKYCRFSGIGWTKDNTGFFYDRFPEPGTVPDEDLTNYNKVYWHTLGTSQSEDKLVYEDKENKELGHWPYTTDDGKYLVLYVYHGTDDRNGIYFREVGSDGEFTKLLDVGEAKYQPIDNIGSTFYFSTDLDAARGRIIAIDVENPDRSNWKELVPEGKGVISTVALVNNHLVVANLVDAHHEIKIHDLKGKFVREIKLPTLGSIGRSGGLSGNREDKELFINFTSFLYPTTIFRYDFETGDLAVFRQPEIDFDTSGYETKQVFFKSKDGTRVPMFITHKKGLKLDGNNPTLMYGYGGFNINILPRFSIARLLWLENGGVYVEVTLRGGNEYGEEWHKAGMLEKKQNVFDDFIAAGETLIKKRYTNSSLLAIEGGSNGGLLVAACMLQRPELFGAVLCHVPVTDMLRYQKFTVGRYWTGEYGNAEENPEHFKFLYAYSPLHNVKAGTTHPPTLILTADTDDRVVPSHAKKFAATVQAADSGQNPILVRIETKAGHGGGKPTTKRIEQSADVYAFLFKLFGMSPTVVGKRPVN